MNVFTVNNILNVNDQYKILVNNIDILYNYDKEYNAKCLIIYDYLKSLNIEYDNELLLDKIKKYNYKLYKVYLHIINTIYESLHRNNHSGFDDYEGYNTWNEDTFLYNEIYNLLSKYDEEIIPTTK